MSFGDIYIFKMLFVSMCMDKGERDVKSDFSCTRNSLNEVN